MTGVRVIAAPITVLVVQACRSAWVHDGALMWVCGGLAFVFYFVALFAFDR